MGIFKLYLLLLRYIRNNKIYLSDIANECRKIFRKHGYKKLVNTFKAHKNNNKNTKYLIITF